MMLFGAKNPLRLVAFGLLLIALVCGCQRPLAANDPADIKALQGTWRVVAIEADLKELPADEIKQKNFLYTFKGNQLTIERKGEELLLSDTRLLFYYQNRLAAHGLGVDLIAPQRSRPKDANRAA